MSIQELQDQALTIAAKYHQYNTDQNQREWDESAYIADFVGDVGDLSKLIMAKQLNIDIEKALMRTMKGLEARF